MSQADDRNPGELVEEGRVLHRAGKLDAAEARYLQALAQDEDFAEAHQLMAVIAGQRGRFKEAIAGFRRTIALEGPTPDRLFNLAEAYRLAGEFAPALEAYNQALTIDASHLDAYRHCVEMVKEAGAAALGRGDSATAERFSKLAAHYLVGLGHACLRTHTLAEAEQSYRASIALDPGRAEAYNCLGAIALTSRRPMEAEVYCRQAWALEPSSALYLTNMGCALLNQVRTDEAAELFRQAIQIDPSFSEAKRNLDDRILPWLHYRSDLNPDAVFAAHQQWGRIAMVRAAEVPAPSISLSLRRDPNRPLRIAYVGLDTGSRFAWSCLEPLIANHNRNEFRPVIYATTVDDPAAMRHFKNLAEEFRLIRMHRPQEIVKTIQAENIDILIDIAGHMDHNRLDVFALKPAPVTASWSAYPGTTGLPTMDYRITDEVADPAGAERFYTENLYRLRSGSRAYRPPETSPAIAQLPARTAGAVTFGNFDDPRKISPAVVQAWSSILRALPAARLIIQAPEFADTAFAARVRADFQVVGISPARIELRVTPGGSDGSLRAYAEVDICLDTFPYNSALTTICDTLWMGVPVITLSGDRLFARTSASVLAQVGLERLNSDTAEEYNETAIELAQDLDRLRNLRSGMRDRIRVSPLMDERDFARRFEAALREMWRRWCESPA